MKNKSRTGLRGFTIVEVLVVIAIMAVLIAVLIPSLEKSRTMARTLKCAAQQRQHGIALMAYAGDDRQSAFPWGSESTAEWMGMIAPYLGWPNTSPYPDITASETHRTKVERVMPVFNCPETDQRKDLSGDYSNGEYGRNVALMAGRGARAYRRRTMSQIRRAPSVLYMHSDASEYNVLGFNHLSDGIPGEPGITQAAEMARMAHTRPRHHQYKVNIGFVDGHVETLAPMERSNLWFSDNGQSPGFAWNAVTLSDPGVP